MRAVENIAKRRILSVDLSVLAADGDFDHLADLPDVQSNIDFSLLPDQRLAGGRDVKFRSQTQIGAEERDTLWSWLAVACVACLLSEVTALKAFRT